jgi:hypothetical protein
LVAAKAKGIIDASRPRASLSSLVCMIRLS